MYAEGFDGSLLAHLQQSREHGPCKCGRVELLKACKQQQEWKTDAGQSFQLLLEGQAEKMYRESEKCGYFVWKCN